MHRRGLLRRHLAHRIAIEEMKHKEGAPSMVKEAWDYNSEETARMTDGRATGPPLGSDSPVVDLAQGAFG